jgi:PAS domain S-box-containing protein
MDLLSDNLEVNDLGRAIKLFRESRDGFLKLFDNSPVCMSMTTTTLGRRTYVRVNKRFLDIFGFGEKEIIGKTSTDIGILDPQESLRVGALIQEKGRLQNDYVQCKTKSGSIVHTISSIEMMELNDQKYLVSFFVDVSKIVEQQTIIEKHAAAMEALNKELEAFSYTVSHDLRAPLRAIDGYAAILQESYQSQLDEEGQAALAAVIRNARKMGHLIDDLLTFSRLGKKPIAKAEINMQALVQEALADLQTAGHKAEVKVGELFNIPGDYALIKQVIFNLLSNAIKYSSKVEHPVVEITSVKTGNNITFTIRDNGVGFDMSYAHKLFGVFQRLHRSVDFEGTGVGLAIVERIITKHGGTVSATGEPQKGATFSFTVPG